MQGQTLLGNTTKQHDSSRNSSTFISSKGTETEATKTTYAILPTSEVSPTDILNQYKARLLDRGEKKKKAAILSFHCCVAIKFCNFFFLNKFHLMFTEPHDSLHFFS